MPVKILASPVVAHGGLRVGVAGGYLYVAEVTPASSMVVTNVWRSMCGCITDIPTPAVAARRLSVDINPDPELAAQGVTSVGGATRQADEVNALLVYAESVGLTDHQARTILREVADAAANWPSIARRNGIAQAETARFEPTLSRTIDAVRLN